MMSKKVIHALVVWLAWLLGAPTAMAQNPGCLGDFPSLFRNLSAGQSAKVTKAYAQYGAKAKNGMLAVVSQPSGLVPDLGPADLDTILEIFGRNVEFDFNPLGTDQRLFEAIADLTEVLPDGSLRMRDGLASTIKDLANKGAGDDAVLFYQGAAHDLFVAEEIGPARIVSLQKEIPVPGGGRRFADLVEECPGDCSGLPGILHENKNWMTPLGGPQDVRLTGLAGQFKRDILIHNQTDFNFYRLNLRETVRADEALIEQTLLAQFLDPEVVNALGAARAEALAALFEGQASSIIRFW